MSNKFAQFFKTPSGDEMVILPRADYDQIVRRQRTVKMSEDEIDSRDAKAILDRIESGDEQVYPVELLDRVIAGEHPVKVYREWRQISQRELGKRAGINPMYLSQIETSRRRGSSEFRRALAAALDVDEELLDPRYQLTHLRLSRGLSIDALAKTTGIAARVIRALERHLRKPRGDELSKLGKALDAELETETAPLSESLLGIAAHPVTRIVLKSVQSPDGRRRGAKSRSR